VIACQDTVNCYSLQWLWQHLAVLSIGSDAYKYKTDVVDFEGKDD